LSAARANFEYPSCFLPEDNSTWLDLPASLLPG
jgi:hypothetical protein